MNVANNMVQEKLKLPRASQPELECRNMKWFQCMAIFVNITVSVICVAKQWSSASVLMIMGMTVYLLLLMMVMIIFNIKETQALYIRFASLRGAKTCFDMQSLCDCNLTGKKRMN